MLLSHILCPKCNTITSHFDGECGPCSTREEAENRRDYFTKLDGMDIEQRLRRIEELLYDQSKNSPWDVDRY